MCIEQAMVNAIDSRLSRLRQTHEEREQRKVSQQEEFSRRTYLFFHSCQRSCRLCTHDH